MKYILSFILILTFVRTNNAQCYSDRHNTTWFHSWTSCETSDNPNSARGNTHWILYDFGHTYKLEDMHIWNINDPSRLDDGMKNIVIDYSQDGNTWTEFGNATLNKATGKSIYEGEDLLSFEGTVTRYLLITAIDNWGGDCFGFSELRINVSEINATELVNFDLDCDEINGITELEWTLTNESKVVSFDVEKSYDGKKWQTINSSGKIAVQAGLNTYKYIDNSNNDAYYRIKISEQDGSFAYSNSHFCSKSFIKLKAYPNPFINSFKAEILAQNDEPIIYTLSDIYGRILRKGVIIPKSTINYLDFENLNVSSGNYFLAVRQGEKLGQMKLTKIFTGL